MIYFHWAGLGKKSGMIDPIQPTCQSMQISRNDSR